MRRGLIALAAFAVAQAVWRGPLEAAAAVGDAEPVVTGAVVGGSGSGSSGGSGQQRRLSSVTVGADGSAMSADGGTPTTTSGRARGLQSIISSGEGSVQQGSFIVVLRRSTGPQAVSGTHTVNNRPAAPNATALRAAGAPVLQSILKGLNQRVTAWQHAQSRRMQEAATAGAGGNDGATLPDGSGQFIARVGQTFNSEALLGFSAYLSVDAMKYLKSTGLVEALVPDQIVSAAVAPPHNKQQQAHQPFAFPQPSLSSPDGVAAGLVRPFARRMAVAEDNAPWHLDRLDQVSLPLDGRYTYTNTGQGVYVFVVDSGIRTSHVELGGVRTDQGANFVPDKARDDISDCSGHGSHIAGTIAGRTVGVAKSVYLVGVRVYGCDASGPLSQVLAGLEWTLDRVLALQGGGARAVINLSFATPRIGLLDEVVDRLIAAGAVVVVAAGNSASDACNTSPAGVGNAITVASTSRADAFSAYSDYGSCVDINAPGESIVSAGIGSDMELVMMSGTSMSCPQVTAVAALYLESNKQATPADVARGLACVAVAGAVTGAPAGTTGILVHSPADGFAAGNPEACGSVVGGPGTGEALNACPQRCNENGRCINGACQCSCAMMGPTCGTQIPIVELVGLRGSVSGSTSGATSWYGDASGDAFFAINVPPAATSLLLNTCNGDTSFDTTLTVTAKCFAGPSTRLDELQLIASNDDAGTTSGSGNGSGSGSGTSAQKCARVLIPQPPQGSYYIHLEGFQQEEGAYRLDWMLDAPAPATGTPPPGTVRRGTGDDAVQGSGASSIRSGSVMVMVAGVLLSVLLGAAALL